ncbi:hypothetical protein E4T56_gene19265 [Termitomyces sp. T112]|nr:hypothetical protein E4T56_gene19265 [Termitomyces sp. T112]
MTICTSRPIWNSSSVGIPDFSTAEDTVVHIHNGREYFIPEDSPIFPVLLSSSPVLWPSKIVLCRRITSSCYPLRYSLSSLNRKVYTNSLDRELGTTILSSIF